MKKAGINRRAFLRHSGIATALGLGGMMTACNREQESASGGGGFTGEPRSGNGEYVEVLALTSLPYFIDHKVGMEQAAKYLGVSTKFLGPSELDLDQMVTTLEQAITQEVSGLVVVGFDPLLAPSINKAIDAGIPAVTVDADVPDSNRLCFLGTGNEQAGELGAQELAKLIGGSGKVIIITRTGQSNLEERVNGYRKVLNAEGIEIVQVANDDSDSTKAASAVTAALRTQPDLAGIACVEAAGGVGTATALREANRAGEVKVVAMDRDAETLEAIEEGTIQASIAQKSALMTFWGVMLLHQFQTLDIPITEDNEAAGVNPLPSYVDTGAELITKENVAQWKKTG